jgi:hypothetical protein
MTNQVSREQLEQFEAVLGEAHESLERKIWWEYHTVDIIELLGSGAAFIYLMGKAHDDVAAGKGKDVLQANPHAYAGALLAAFMAGRSSFEVWGRRAIWPLIGILGFWSFYRRNQALGGARVGWNGYPHHFHHHGHAAPRPACPDNVYDASGRCHKIWQSLIGKRTVGDPSPVPNSNFDDRGGTMCQCWANVDVFGNIQDHNTCYHSKDDANNKTNGFPGRPLDFQGGDYFTAVPCPSGAGTASLTPPASGSSPPPSTATGWEPWEGWHHHPHHHDWWQQQEGW